jgi:quercetin dioxygenase-like cupin family protein
VQAEEAMTIRRLTSVDFTRLENPGKISEQMVWPQNAPGLHVTITRVTMRPGAISPRHAHADAEQIWLITHGEATLLMDSDQASTIRRGDVICTPPGDVHGVVNSGDEAFVYLSITYPPQDFTSAYQRKRKTD